MKKTTITISFDEEKVSALKMYLDQKNMSVETELEKSLDILYTKNVPSGVRDFIDMKSGNASSTTPKVRKTKNSSSPVGAVTPMNNTDESKEV